MKQCLPIIYGDSTKCSRCGMAWDTNDENAPKCRRALIREMKATPVGHAIPTASTESDLLLAWADATMGTFTAGRYISLYKDLSGDVKSYTVKNYEDVDSCLPGAAFLTIWTVCGLALLGVFVTFGLPGLNP